METHEPTDPSARVSALEREHGPTLRRYARSLCGDPDWASDAVQDAFLRLLRHPDEAQAGAERPWLFRVCRSRIIDRWRKEGRMSLTAEFPDDLSTASPEPSPAATAERADAVARLLALVDTLPPAQREVVRLRFQGDLSYQEIAGVTARTVSHVGVLLHEALKTLRQRARSEGLSTAQGA